MADRERRQDEGRRAALTLSNEAAGYLKQGRPEEALPLLRQALERQPDDVGILLNLGGAYVLLGRHEEAIAVLERATQLAPDEPMAWCNLGAALLRLPGEGTGGDQLRAVDAFCRGLELDPRAPNVAYNLGLIHRDREEWSEAARYFALAASADPDDNDARSLLQKMEARLGVAEPDEGAEGEGSDAGQAPPA